METIQVNGQFAAVFDPGVLGAAQKTDSVILRVLWINVCPGELGLPNA